MANLILTDIDETVLQFANPFHQWMNSRGYRSNGSLRDNYCMQKTFDISREEVDKQLTAFANETDWLSNLPPEDCAATVLPSLHKKGFQFVGITAIDHAFHDQRLDNLERVFGFRFLALHCIGFGASKREALGSYPKGIWVEDHPQHASDGADIGHRSFLLNRAYNLTAEVSNVTRVDDWHAINDLITEN